MATPSTVNTWPVNGVIREFDITFDYLSRNFVQVSLIGGDFAKLVLGTDYTFVTNTRIRTTLQYGAPYTAIEIRRVTSTTERLVEFQDASILHAQDLNIDSLQVMHVAEEAREAATETIGVNGDGNLDARGRRIVNLATAVQANDALPLGQYLADKGGAAESAAAAAVSAGQARDSALGAALSATQANTAAGNANTQANRAEGAAVQAETSMGQAAAQATAAAGSASAASGSAGAAAGSATNAANSATAAAGSASAASTSATNAAASLSTFQNQYWGTYSSDPTSGPGGRPRVAGVFYFNTSTNTHRVWTGTAWVNAPQGPAGANGAPGAPGKNGSIPRRGWRFSYVNASKVRFAAYTTEFIRVKQYPGDEDRGFPFIYQDDDAITTTEYTLGQGAWGGLQNNRVYCVVDYGINSANEISVAPVTLEDAQPTWDQEFGWIRGGVYLGQRRPIYGAFALVAGQFRDDELARCVLSTANQQPRHFGTRLSGSVPVGPGVQNQVIASVQIVTLATQATFNGMVTVQAQSGSTAVCWATWAALTAGQSTAVQLDGAAIAVTYGATSELASLAHVGSHPFAPGMYTIQHRASNQGPATMNCLGNPPLGLNWGFTGTLFDRQ